MTAALRTFFLAVMISVSSAEAASDPAETGHPNSVGFSKFPVVEELPLFQKLDVNSRRISLWNRVYALDESGLLKTIENDGENFLVSPMRLAGKVNGSELALPPSQQQVIEETFNSYRVRSEATFANADVVLTTLVENDGMVRFTIEISSEKEIAFEDIAIRLPLKSQLFDYLHYIAETRSKSATLELPGGNGLVWGSRDAQTHFVEELQEFRSDIGGFLKNANVKNSFLPLVWIGNGRSGLAWFAESDQGWLGQEGRSIVELTRHADVLELTLNIILGKAARKQLSIDFGLQATPVKPLPPQWRNWQHYNARGLHEGTQIEKNQSIYDENIVADFGDILMFDLDCIGLDTPNRFSRTITHPENTRQFLQRCRQRNYKVFTYVTPFLIDQVEDATDDRKEWERVPALSRPWNHDGVAKHQSYLCHNATGNLLHILEYVERLVSEYDLDGVYIDVPFFNGGCMAPGCCYTREDGQKQPIFKIFQLREFYKKLASIFVRHGKYPYLLVHNSTGTLIPAYSFCWAGKPGEFMADIGYSMNHNEFFRRNKAKAIVEFNPHAWGLVTFCMDDIKITRYQQLKANPEFTDKETFEDHFKARYMGIPLLHDSLVMNWCSTPKFSYPVQRARKEFGAGEDDTRFHPYWESKSMKSGHPDVELSYYLRGRGVMLNLVNFSDDDVDLHLTLSQEVLDVIGNNSLIDPISGEEVKVEGGVARFSIPAQLYRVLMHRGQ